MVRSALDYVKVKENRNDTALVIQDSWFMKVSWGPNWMRGLQLWNEIQTERAIREQGAKE